METNKINKILKQSDWALLESDFEGSSNSYDVAFLMAPNIPFPNPTGNAIASLTESLASNISYRSIIFSAPSGDTSNSNKVSSHFGLAYYLRPLNRSIWDRGQILPRIKKLFFTPISIPWRTYARSCAEICLKLGVKVLIIEDVADFGWVVRKVRKYGIKIILHQHAFTQRNYLNYQWRRIQKQLDRVVFVSNTTINQTEKLHGKMTAPTTVIYNGVDLDLFDPQKFTTQARQLREHLNILLDYRVITFVGRLIKSKGLLEALKAYLLLNDRNVHFLMITSKEINVDKLYEDEILYLKNQIETLGLPLHFFENVPQEEMPVYYSVSDFVLLPSIGFEGLPKVITESLAMGVPVIASDRGGTWELLQEGRNSWKIDNPVNSRTILDALNQALSIDAHSLAFLRKEIIASIRPKMDQKIMIEKFDQVLHKVLEN